MTNHHEQLIGGEDVLPNASNINALRTDPETSHKLPHKTDLAPQMLIELSRALRVRARRKPYQQLAGEFAMNLTYYAERRPDEDLRLRLSVQLGILERAREA